MGIDHATAAAMTSPVHQRLDAARRIAGDDPGRARVMFEALAAEPPGDVWSEAQVELALLAYRQLDLDEVARRADTVLASDMATPWATAVAGVLTNLAAEQTDRPVDEAVLMRSAVGCVEVGDPYDAGLARSLIATSRLRAGDRASAIHHLRAAADLYELAGSMTAGPGVLLRLSEALAADGDLDGAMAAVQRGLAHVARFPYGGGVLRRLTERLQVAASELWRAAAGEGDAGQESVDDIEPELGRSELRGTIESVVVTSSAPLVDMSCPQCHLTGTATVSESFVGGRVCWGYEFRCENGHAHAIDGRGLAPEPYRSVLLAHESFRLDPSSPIADVTGMKAMRKLYDGGLLEARAQWRDTVHGRHMTRAEMMRLNAELGLGASFLEDEAGRGP